MSKVNKKFIIEPTEDSPHVILDVKKNLIKITGSSFPEDAVDFYAPIIRWLVDNEENFSDKILCEFEYTILSSASNKMVFEILLKFEEFIKNGNKILVKWYYSSFDEDMFDEGKGFKDSMKVPFELIEKETF